MTDIIDTRSVSIELAERVRERMKDPRKIWGIPYGLAGLDALTGGIHHEEMTVLMARPGVGKTQLAGQIALNVAEYLTTADGRKRFPKTVVKLVLCEMSAASFQMRIVCQRAQLSMRRVREGRLTLEQLASYDEAAEYVAGLPIHYLDSPTSLEGTLKWLSADPKPAYYVVDYIGIHPHSPNLSESQYTKVSGLSAGFRQFSKRMAPGLILAQQNREVEKREDTRPKMSDLRDSGNLEQDAWNIMGLWREDVFTRVADEDRNRPKPASLFVLKHRNGPLGTVELQWRPNKMRFEDISHLVADDEV